MTFVRYGVGWGRPGEPGVLVNADDVPLLDADLGACGNVYLRRTAIETAEGTLHARISPGDLLAECVSCAEKNPMGECPGSPRSCRHHCNHSWSHGACCWCPARFTDELTPA